MGIQGREVKQSHAVYHEAGQMVGRQTVAQGHCQIGRGGVVHLFECSTHAQEYTITDGGYVLLSDKLLDLAYLEDADLNGVWMPQAFLRKAKLSRAKLIEAELRGAKLIRAD